MIKNKSGNARPILTRRLIQSAHPRTSYRTPKIVIKNIITSLQKNVGQLKQYYESHDIKFAKSNEQVNQHKKTPQFRTRKSLHKNPSQRKLKTIEQTKSIDKSMTTDIFEIKSLYSRAIGRQTNSIVELYEFYKKNLEKREKSTRILASMEFSNAHYGSSLQKSQFQAQKENNSKANNSSKMFSSNITEKAKHERVSEEGKFVEVHKNAQKEKPSKLASDLMKKGCYNLANVANLLTSKRYHLNKVNEDSLIRLPSGKKNNRFKQKSEEKVVPSIKSKHQPIEQFSIKQNNAYALNVKEISFNQSKMSFEKIKLDKSIETSSIDASSIKNSRKKSSQGSMNKELDQKQLNFFLSQSPILKKSEQKVKKQKDSSAKLVRKEIDFDGSPIIMNDRSRIIDLELIPFEL